MLNRRFVSLASVMMAMILCAAPALAQGMKTYAVIPFDYNGPKKYSYFPKALQQMLSNDLEWSGHVEPAPDSTVDEMKTPKSKADALNALKTTGVDYIVSGSISILNKDASLKLVVHGAENTYWENKGQMTVDEITPWLDDQSKAIMGDVFHRPGYSTAEKAKDATPEAAAVANAPLNSGFVAGDSQYQADALNPQFRYEGGSSSIGRWRSQTIRYSSNSMVVADGDGDGKNEVFILHKKGITAYRYKDGKLDHLETFPLSPNTIFLRLEAADITRDGTPELIIASYQQQFRSAISAPDGRAKSHIMSFKGGKFKFLKKNYNRFLGVFRMPPTYMPILVTQKRGTRSFFDQRVKEAHYKDGDITIGGNVSVPPFGNIFGIAFIPDKMGYKWLVLDEPHRLRVYDQTMEALSSSDEDTYNSSGIGIEYNERPPGVGPGSNEISASFNVPMRMVPALLGSKSKWEVLMNKDLSVAARIFESFTYYSQGEIHSLAWDGVGMNLSWKTRRIKGQVSDIGLEDLNNDGKKQLCVLVNTFPGGLGFTKRKTVVLAYDLNM